MLTLNIIYLYLLLVLNFHNLNLVPLDEDPFLNHQYHLKQAIYYPTKKLKGTITNLKSTILHKQLIFTLKQLSKKLSTSAIDKSLKELQQIARQIDIALYRNINKILLIE